MNEKIIWDYLINKLNNPYGVAALMGNLFAESSLNPLNATGNKNGLTNQQYTDAADARRNENFITDNVAYGLAQWRYHSRKRGLYELALKEGKSVGDLGLQLDYLWQELQAYKTVLNRLYSAKDIRSASDLVLTKYERPATQTEAVKIKRAQHGQKYFDRYNSITVNRQKLQNVKTDLKEILAVLKEK